jgi:hypothetical protein
VAKIDKKNREYKTKWDRESRQEGRELGNDPDPVNLERRNACEYDLRRFCVEYLTARFDKPFSDDHLRVIQSLQDCILTGGQYAVAMPRGSGKTTLCESAATWALLFGHRRFLMVIGSDAQASLQICASIRNELDSNDLLLDDFPEAVRAIRSLEGVARRAEGQIYTIGNRTQLIWTKNEVRLPCRAAGGGSVIRTAGITGRIRGAKASLADGSQVRPDLVLIDDPQTDESAKSPSQVADRLKTINSTVLGLAGPGQKIAALCTVTIIERGDLADQLLDRRINPQWQGQTSRLMASMPTNQKLWDTYAETLREGLRDGSGTKAAFDFYRDNRDAMDAGAQASWKERFAPGEHSAIQHGMNLRILRGEAAFEAEYQNSPMDPSTLANVQQLTASTIVQKLNHHEKGTVPIEDSTITVGIDVQGSCLYWLAAAWSPTFSGDIIAYGAYPDQGRPYFIVREIQKTMEKEHAGGSWEAALHASLETLVAQLVSFEWKSDHGDVQHLDQIVIDAGYGASTETVHKFCRRSAHASLLMPYFGRAVAPGQTPLDEWKKKPGDKIGLGWRISKNANRQARAVLADPNVWKSFLADRILAKMGDAGCLSLYGSSSAEHRMLADHLSSEARTRVSANGRTSDQWKMKPNKENHWLDCLVMSAIGASIRGCKLDLTASRKIEEDLADHIDAQAVKTPSAPAPVAPNFGDNFGFGGGFSGGNSWL